MPHDAILQISDYSGGFLSQDHEPTPVLHNVSFALRRGALTAIVGETGSGKSLLALSMLGITPTTFQRTGGSIVFDGIDLTTLSEKELRGVRGSQISLVFQDARGSLNPVFTIGKQLTDVCRTHHGVSHKVARVMAIDILDRVRVPEPARRMEQYPHEFSGGMAQRAMLAMALICRPALLILDEPTTGLDVTIQADIIDLIASLTISEGMTTCLITHDLGIVTEAADDVIVMQHGAVVETGSCEQIMTDPHEAYTRALISDSRMGEVTA